LKSAETFLIANTLNEKIILLRDDFMTIYNLEKNLKTDFDLYDCGENRN
jgi:hypothetical protein